MKKKALLALMFSVMASQAYAVQMDSGVLLNHKEWQTGKAGSVTYKDITSTSRNIETQRNHHALPGEIFDTHTSIRPYLTDIYVSPVGGRSYFGGGNEIAVTNLSQQEKTLTFYSYVCVVQYVENGGRIDLGCNDVSDDVVVYGRSAVKNDKKLALNYVFDSPGNYSIETYTTVRSDHKDIFTANARRDVTVEAARIK